MHILREPDRDAALAFFQSGLATLRNRRGCILQVLAGCQVDYAGRAASTLDQGERLVLLKADGTLLVHTAEKAKPVNWMPPGANDMNITAEGDNLVLTVVRRKPHHEMVRITFFDIRLLLSLPVRDSEELVLRRTEGDLHALFYHRPELIEPGLIFHRGEKDTRRGPVDLWGTDSAGRRVLVEVKRSKAGIAEATQLWRYVEMERSGRYKDGATNGDAEEVKVRGVLVAPGISGAALQMLADHGLEHRDIDWDDLLAHLDAPRAAGQATLARFEGPTARKTEAAPATVRTGKRRRG